LIDPRACVDPKASIGKDVSIGPFTVIGPDVSIGDNCWVGPHVVIEGKTRIGRDNKIFQFSSVGADPQDKKYADEDTQLVIGDGNTIRECATINRGTVQGGGITQIGNDNLIMAYVHIAHDCIIANHAIFSNNASLAGHVIVEDYAILGGFTLVHQFCNIGAHCFTAMGSVVAKDVPPYVLVSGHMAKPHGLNTNGLKRRGFSDETLRALRQAYKVLYKSKLPLKQALKDIKQMTPQSDELAYFTVFIEKAERGIVR